MSLVEEDSVLKLGLTDAILGPRVEFPQSTIHALFSAQATLTPHATALEFGERQLSFAELETRSNRLAHYLIEQGVKLDTPVALLLQRSPELVVAMLAVLKAGGAYVPLDPTYPAARIGYILQDAQSPLLITQKNWTEAFLPTHRQDSGRTVLLDELESEVSQYPDTIPQSGATTDAVAYIVYTSGSTGNPKGVEGLHRGAINRFNWMWNKFPFTPDEICCQKTSHCFVDSIWEIFGPLLKGIPVVIIPDEVVIDPRRLVQALSSHRITRLVLVPSLLRAILNSHADLEQVLPKLYLWTCSGEALTTELTRHFYRALPQSRLLNLYGSSEVSADVTWFLTDAQHLERAVPIGKPLDNTTIHLLDENLLPVSTGQIGEIYVGGANLARGYLRQPQMTSERFVTISDGIDTVLRLYKTGDLGRLLPDGNIEYSGRSDHQVKLRGYRIELGEIETVLREHPELSDAVAVAREDMPGEKILVVYFVPRTMPGPSASVLRMYLGQRLPAYMLPEFLVALERFPLTPNGKLDRRKLPAPERTRAGAESEYLAPRTKLETLLVELWREVLNLDRVGIRDHFFELGGDSIKGAVFINRLQDKLGEIVYIVTLFDAPTIEQYAAFLEKNYPEAVSNVTGVKPSVNLDEYRKERIDPSKFARFQALIKSLGKRVGTFAKNPRPIFILTPPRSGSTLLRVITAGNDRVFAPPELELLNFNSMGERFRHFSGRDNYRREGLIRALMEVKNCDVEVATKLMEQCEAEDWSTHKFYQMLQSEIGSRMLVDKTPSYTLDPTVLQRAEDEFDEPLYIHLVRHPLGMIRSFEEARLDQIFFYQDSPFSRRQLGELIWLQSHTNIVNFLSRIPTHRWCRVTYEDLVAQPEQTVRRLCELLNITFNADMLDPYSDRQKKMTDGLHDVGRMLGDPKFHQHQKINAENADTWKSYYTEDFLSAMTWELADKLGYPRWYPNTRDQDTKSVQFTLPEKSDGFDSLVVIKKSGHKRPFFCIHPASGSLLCYGNLSRHFDPERPMIGLQARGFATKVRPHTEMREMAADYIKEIKCVQPEGPYLLGGRCMGAFVAFEMAQQLKAQNNEILLLALLDPLHPPRLADGVIPARVTKLQTINEDRQLKRPKSMQRRLRKYRRFIKNWIDYLRMSHEEKELQKVRAELRIARKTYRAHVFDGTIMLWCNSELDKAPECIRGWEQVAGQGLDVVMTPGSHFNMVREPHVRTLAQQLNERLDLADGTR